MNDITIAKQPPGDILVVDRSDSGYRRLQLNMLNTECPDSPIAGITLQGIARQGESKFVPVMEFVFRKDIHAPSGGADDINQILKKIGKQVNTSGFSIPNQSDRNRQFFLNVTRTVAFYRLLPCGDDDLREVIEFMHQEGLVGKRIRDMVTQFAMAMENGAEMAEAPSVSGSSARQIGTGTNLLGPGR